MIDGLFGPGTVSTANRDSTVVHSRGRLWLNPESTQLAQDPPQNPQLTGFQPNRLQRPSMTNRTISAGVSPPGGWWSSARLLRTTTVPGKFRRDPCQDKTRSLQSPLAGRLVSRHPPGAV